MKTTIEIPDTALQRAKAAAADRGATLNQFFTEALEEKLRRCADEDGTRSNKAPRLAGFGALSDLAHENRRVLDLVEAEFETVFPEDLA